MVRLAIYDRKKTRANNEFITHAEAFKRKYETESEISIVEAFRDTCSGIAAFEEKPELKRLLEKCKSGDVDIVVMQSVSRLSRDTMSMFDTLKKFQGTKVVVWFEEEKMAIGEAGSSTYSDVDELLKSYEMRPETSETFSLQNMI